MHLSGNSWDKPQRNPTSLPLPKLTSTVLSTRLFAQRMVTGAAKNSLEHRRLRVARIVAEGVLVLVAL